VAPDWRFLTLENCSGTSEKTDSAVVQKQWRDIQWRDAGSTEVCLTLTEATGHILGEFL
jgi:hypothetical protein